MKESGSKLTGDIIAEKAMRAVMRLTIIGLVLLGLRPQATLGEGASATLGLYFALLYFENHILGLERRLLSSIFGGKSSEELSEPPEDGMDELKEIARLRSWDVPTAWEKSKRTAGILEISPTEGIAVVLEAARVQGRVYFRK
jgi:hypothetical protein